ncbi:alpha-tocopherol transfer protein-like isoform X2 [Rhodnius prolixus]|uniref:Putative phosphatidylinositol transfer protein sec14 n=2 Tax=Rhodnius prolixus TaxID=13249 RepID=R4G355_RHOPR
MSVTGVTPEQEYLKNSDLKREDIDTLREWVKTQHHLPPISEQQLILFHHSCYYNLEATKSCIEVYYRIRLSTPEFFCGRDISKATLKQSAQVLQCGCLPVKDPNGFQIIFHGLQQHEASKYVFVDGVKLLVMSIDACLHSEGTVPGYVFLFNMKGVKLTHLTRLSIGYLRKFFEYIQEGLPVRLKAIHVVNTLPIIDKIMFMIKPFMKKELLNLLHFHYGGYEEVQKFLPKYCLPKDFEGELPSCADLQDKYVEWMTKLTPYFLEAEKLIYKESKKNSKDSEELQEVSLRGLTID